MAVKKPSTKHSQKMAFKKTALVCGAGGFIGSHLVKRLRQKGYQVTGIDLKKPEFSKSAAHKFILLDLRNQRKVQNLFKKTTFDEVYQLAADMGGAGYVFTGDHDADVMFNSVQINLNILDSAYKSGVKKIFFSSSACIYPAYNQEDPDNPKCHEDSAYPAAPDSEYGWEKIFSERLYLTYNKNLGMQVRIARFHNIFGPEGTWTGGKEKAPAAICRKVAQTPDGGTIEIWGDGKQTRSFLFIDECLDGIMLLMNHDSFSGPVNIGSEEMVSINHLAEIAMNISGKKLKIKHIKGPLGVRGRNSDNRLLRKTLQWEPKMKLSEGIEKTYIWIEQQLNNQKLQLSKNSTLANRSHKRMQNAILKQSKPTAVPSV